MTLIGLNDAGPTLDRLLKAATLDPDRLPPGDAWNVFKEFARLPADADDDVLYVQFFVPDPLDELLHVTYIRQLELADAAGELEPVREVVCDIGYPATRGAPEAAELCSADFATLDTFFDAVESRPEFRIAMGEGPIGSTVTWSEL
jgi:hypothetical protein